MALITFGPSGETMNTNMVVAQKGPTYPPPAATPPVVDLEDNLTGGTLGAQVSNSQQNYIIWKDHNTESTRARWPMDSEGAVADGLDAISTADAAGTAITLLPDGTAGS